MMTPNDWRRIMSVSPRLATALFWCVVISAVLGIIGLLADIFGWR